MALLTAAECILYSSITASATTITSSNLLNIVQNRICMITNNYFTTDLYWQGDITFNAIARTVAATDNLEYENFLANDDFYIYNSYRNDGIFTIDSISGSTITVISGQSVVDELSGRSIMLSIIKWPLELKQIAAYMVAYDYDVRPSTSSVLKSRSLGPFSESYINAADEVYGYPKKIANMLESYTIGRLM